MKSGDGLGSNKALSYFFLLCVPPETVLVELFLPVVELSLFNWEVTEVVDVGSYSFVVKCKEADVNSQGMRLGFVKDRQVIVIWVGDRGSYEWGSLEGPAIRGVGVV